IRSRQVKPIENFAHATLRLPWLPGVVVEISRCVARLVAMRVLTNQSGNVRLFAAGGLAFSGEHFIQLARKLLLAAHQSDEPADVLRNEERVLPRIRFREVKVDFAWIEWRKPAAIAAGPHKACLTVKHILIELRSGEIAFVVILAAEHLRDLRDTPIVVSILECFRD